MNALQKTGQASKYLFATLGATLIGAKPPKPPERANDSIELEVNSLNISGIRDV
jgi:hypothetical protein